jgi:hypothetical protein
MRKMFSLAAVRVMVVLAGLVDLARAVTIQTEPEGGRLPYGRHAVLTVETSGGAATFQWFTGISGDASRPIVGATNAFLNTLPVTGPASYWVRIDHADGFVFSETATLDIEPREPLILKYVGGSLVAPVIRATNVLQAASRGPLWTIRADASFWQEGTKLSENAAQLAGGRSHALFIKTDGSLWGLGDNRSGQLGNGTTASAYSPIRINQDVAQVAAGNDMSLFLKQNGTLWGMGSRSSLFGSSSVQRVPLQLASGVISIAAGDDFVLFLRADHSLWGMGRNGGGQLGTGDGTMMATNVVSMSGGMNFAIYITRDRELWGVGSPLATMLAEGGGFPSAVRIAEDVAGASAGGRHLVFWRADGSLWAVGDNSVGQLGDGSTTSRSTPVKVADNVVEAVAGTDQTRFLQLPPPRAPVITSQPNAVKLARGNPAHLQVIAEGTQPISYQWFEGAAGDSSRPIAGATSGTLTTAPLTESTMFWVRVSNVIGFSDSAAAAVTAIAPPVIAEHPRSQTVYFDDPATLEVAVVGTDVSLQWYSGESGNLANPIRGVVGNTYQTPRLFNQASFWARATNLAGFADSRAAVIDVVPAPITRFPRTNQVNLSSSLTGVSTWPGYRRPRGLTDLGARDGRTALAGDGLGALLLEGDGEPRRFITAQGAANRVKLGEKVLYAMSAGEGQVFGLGASGGAGEFRGAYHNGHEGLDLLRDSLFSSTHSDFRIHRVTDPLRPLSVGNFSLPFATVNSVQVCEVSGEPVAVALIAPNLQNASLQAQGINPLLLPATHDLGVRLTYSGNERFDLADDGRLAVRVSESLIRLLRVQVAGGRITLEQTAELTVPDMNLLSRLALGPDRLAVHVSGPAPERIEFFDVSSFSAPRRWAALPLPLPESAPPGEHHRFRNQQFLTFDGTRFLFAGSRGDFLEADVSDPENPRWIQSAILTGDTERVAHNGSRVLAVEGPAYTLRLVDLGDGSTPQTLETMPLADSIGGIAWRGHMAYAEAGGSVHAIDFSARDRPEITSTAPISGWGASRGLAVEGASLVMGASGAGLAFFSLEIPERPRLRAQLTGAYLALATGRGHAYAIVNRNNGRFLRVFDLNDPANPIVVEELPAPENFGTADERRLEVEGGRLWVHTRRLSPSIVMLNAYLFDLGNPALPAYRGQVDLSGSGQAVGSGDFLVRTWMETSSVTSSARDPWGASPRRIRVDRIDLTGDTPQLNGPLATAFFHQSPGPGPGRPIDLGLPHVVGDLILAPTGLHGLDVLRSEQLPRTAPNLVHPPESRTVPAGRRSALSATVDGALPLTFQWLKDGAPVEDGSRVRGARTFALVFDPAESGDAGSYQLIVRNDAGAAASLPVRLEVISAQALRLRLGSSSETAWRIELNGTPGQIARLQSSENLVTWQEENSISGAAEFALENGVAVAEIRRRNDTQRYYRAVAVE